MIILSYTYLHNRLTVVGVGGFARVHCIFRSRGQNKKQNKNTVRRLGAWVVAQTPAPARGRADTAAGDRGRQAAEPGLPTRPLWGFNFNPKSLRDLENKAGHARHTRQTHTDARQGLRTPSRRPPTHPFDVRPADMAAVGLQWWVWEVLPGFIDFPGAHKKIFFIFFAPFRCAGARPLRN